MNQIPTAVRASMRIQKNNLMEQGCTIQDATDRVIRCHEGNYTRKQIEEALSQYDPQAHLFDY